jgi:16S rRNA (cytidine1402-2'-O)-methyltransferase
LEPALYIVATPIGNLGDITRRALEVLAAADLVAAEDSRRTGQLLLAQGIEAKMLPYHEHSAPAVAERIVQTIAGGAAVALVSDAGTPTISDPGYRLVRAVQDAQLRVVPVPGACAAITALSAAGLPSDRFGFDGFLPARGEARRARLKELERALETRIFYEAPHRILETLEDCVAVLGAGREAALGRELTKRFETLRRGTLGALLAWVREDDNQARGEIVLLIGPAADQPEGALDQASLQLLRDLAALVPARKAAKLVARYTGRPARALYDELLKDRE